MAVFLIIIFFISLSSYSQNSPQVINTSGNYFFDINYLFEVSIGEPLIETFSNKSNILTQGFLQPLQPQASAITKATEGVFLSCYPNPFVDKIYFQSNNKLGLVQIFDMSGMLIISDYIIENNINLSWLSAGLYYLRLFDNFNMPIATLKICKLNF
ncbi:MAG: T9SS type A sorting domain-containing protein [Bacteroidota bacterium]|nr:T9SS type A sorting domain-containing protein [Bacteroidota bacterium]